MQDWDGYIFLEEKILVMLHVQDPHGSISSRVVEAGSTEPGVQAAAAARRLQGLRQQLQELEPEWCALYKMACVGGFCNIYKAAIKMLCDEHLVMEHVSGKESKELSLVCGQESAQRMQGSW